MDMSKLPKFSRTPAPATSPTPENEPAAELPVQKDAAYSRSVASPAPVSVGAEAWISIVVGFILLFMFDRILKYLFLRNKPGAFEKLWTFSDKNGQPIAYTASDFFISDAALAVFAIVLVLDGLMLAFARRAAIVAIALVLTVAAVLFNLFALVKLYPESGFQIWPALAIAFGGYTAFQQWALLQSMKRA